MKHFKSYVAESLKFFLYLLSTSCLLFPFCVNLLITSHDSFISRKKRDSRKQLFTPRMKKSHSENNWYLTGYKDGAWPTLYRGKNSVIFYRLQSCVSSSPACIHQHQTTFSHWIFDGIEDGLIESQPLIWK